MLVLLVPVGVYIKTVIAVSHKSLPIARERLLNPIDIAGLNFRGFEQFRVRGCRVLVFDLLFPVNRCCIDVIKCCGERSQLHVANRRHFHIF